MRKKYVVLGVLVAGAVLLAIFWKKLFSTTGVFGEAGLVSLALNGDTAVVTAIEPIAYESGTSETPQSGADFNGTPFPTTVFAPLSPH